MKETKRIDMKETKPNKIMNMVKEVLMIIHFLVAKRSSPI